MVHSDQYTYQWATSNHWPTSKRQTVGGFWPHAMQIVQWRVLGMKGGVWVTESTAVEMLHSAPSCLYVSLWMCCFCFFLHTVGAHVTQEFTIFEHFLTMFVPFPIFFFFLEGVGGKMIQWELDIWFGPTGSVNPIPLGAHRLFFSIIAHSPEDKSSPSQ